MVRIPAFHAGGPGSIPGVGTCFLSIVVFRNVQVLEKPFHSVFSLHMYLKRKDHVRRPGVEPGSTAWKATMLTVTPPTLLHRVHFNSQTGLHSVFNFRQAEV